MATRARRSRPFVTANFASTWDGRITTRNGTPADFSSKRDKRRLLEIRSTGDAVLSSVKTIAADRMTMGMPVEELRAARRARGQSEYPLRVLITNRGEIDPGLRVFEKTFSPIVIFSTTAMPEEVRTALAPKAHLHLHDARAVDLPKMLQTLRRQYDVKRLVYEGGAQVFRSLLELDLVDEFHLTFCPRIFGSEAAPTITGPAGPFLPHSIPCTLRSMEVIEGECFLRYRIERKS
jgi:riboflavin-specific deaminase-like protein